MHVLDYDESQLAARALALYPALYNAVADARNLPTLEQDERERLERLADRLSTPVFSVEEAVEAAGRADA